MASKNSKATKREALNGIPVLPLTILFRWVMKPATDKAKTVVIYEGTTAHIVDSLPKVVEKTVTVTRLRGVAHDPEVTSAFAFVGRESVYDMEKVAVSTPKMEEAIMVSWSTLTKADSLLNFMLNNGVKMYLNAIERKTRAQFLDRNFAEICGSLLSTDPAKAHANAQTVKLVKDDIKDAVILNNASAENAYSQSPLRNMASSLRALPGAAEVLASAKEAAAAKKEARKALLNAIK
jgi:hypothetical protein